MHITRKGDYAIRVVVDLARAVGGTARTEDVARRTDVPRAYLSKIVQALAHAGLVRTQRGTRGGITLAEAPQAITLRQVIEAVEGPISVNRCVLRRGICPRDTTCPVRPVWLGIQDLVLHELDAVRVQDLTTPVEEGRACVRPTQREVA